VDVDGSRLTAESLAKVVGLVCGLVTT